MGNIRNIRVVSGERRIDLNRFVYFWSNVWNLMAFFRNRWMEIIDKSNNETRRGVKNFDYSW